MPRRRSPFLADVSSALLRLSHRVPLIGGLVAVGCVAGWWYLSGSAAFAGSSILAQVCLWVGVFFGLIAVVGFLRNLFPEGDAPRRRGR